jgi:peptide chain release factor 1
LKVLASRLSSASQEKAESEQNNTRKSQVGTGMRGDKIRTYRVQDDRITDHRTNQKLNLASWMRGEW